MQKSNMHIAVILAIVASAFLFRYLAIDSRQDAESYYQATGSQLDDPFIVKKLVFFYYYFSVYHILLVAASIMLIYAYINELHSRQRNTKMIKE